MDRIEFCNLLVRAKEQSGKSTNTVSFDLRMQWSTLRRFEKGANNSNMKKVFEYMAVIDSCLHIVSDNSDKTILNYDDLISWITKERNGKYTQRQIAKIINISYVMIANIESRKNSLTIDVFLRIIDALGYTVKIERI